MTISPIHFGWTIKTNNTSLQRAIDKHMQHSPNLPDGYGLDDGRDYYIQVRRDQTPMDARVELRKNAKLVFDWLPSFGAEGGEQIHEFDQNFLALTLSRMAEEILKVLQSDLKS